MRTVGDTWPHWPAVNFGGATVVVVVVAAAAAAAVVVWLAVKRVTESGAGVVDVVVVVVVDVVVVVEVAASISSGQQTPGAKADRRQTERIRLRRLSCSVRHSLSLRHAPKRPLCVVHGAFDSMKISTPP